MFEDLFLAANATYNLTSLRRCSRSVRREKPSCEKQRTKVFSNFIKLAAILLSLPPTYFDL